MINYLYIHIPFCIKKCVYCDFYSIPLKPRIAEDYTDALCNEIKLRTLSSTKWPLAELRTVYIGGGTPTILNEKDISKILDTVRNQYSVRPEAEITIEANPETITLEKAEALLKAGINRISIGVQSFIDRELSILGRSHNADDAVKAVKDTRDAGFKNISIDLIYGIPSFKFQISDFKSQIRNWEYSLQKTLELNPEHLSAYELTPEKNTPLYEDIKSGRLIMPDEDVIAEMYYSAIDTLTRDGYNHYEISNFAKPEYECVHNLNYWNRGEYLGIGSGAHSFFNDKRSCNIKDVSRYVEIANKGEIPLTEETGITGDEALKETIFLGLRKTDGIDISMLPYGKRPAIKKAADELASHGLVELDNNIFRLTRKGLLLSNEVIVKVLLYIEESRLS
ncbi:MAG: radical SAM family heme chaperone HemW [Nitrospirae bacterium]|nr:radical SAM family heme chaperone HemW [Nitrospirota bacterium]MCL5976821.1 radical SAM family heme chaperone HemW [Nitrospirota bacterium]